jgi:translation elongation factor EF-4
VAASMVVSICRPCDFRTTFLRAGLTKEKEVTITTKLPLDQFISQVLSNIHSGIKGQNLQHGKQYYNAEDVKFDILVNEKVKLLADWE